MPFAGTYVLTGKLNKLQDLRGVPLIDEAYAFLARNIDKSKNIEAIRLNNESTYCFEKREYSKKFELTNTKNFKNYQNNYLSKQILDYEADIIPKENDIFEKSFEAVKNYFIKKNELNMEIKSDIYFSVNEKYFKIPSNSSKAEIIYQNEINKNNSYVVYNVDLKLFSRLLGGPKFAHWQNAEIGSHLNFFRSPNTYERDLYFSTIYFHQ